MQTACRKSVAFKRWYLFQTPLDVKISVHLAILVPYFVHVYSPHFSTPFQQSSMSSWSWSDLINSQWPLIWNKAPAKCWSHCQAWVSVEAELIRVQSQMPTTLEFTDVVSTFMSRFYWISDYNFQHLSCTQHLHVGVAFSNDQLWLVQKRYTIPYQLHSWTSLRYPIPQCSMSLCKI